MKKIFPFLLVFSFQFSFFNTLGAQTSSTAFTVYSQGGLKLPWGLYNLTLFDGRLYGCSDGLMMAGEPAPLPVAASGADTMSSRFIAHLSPDTLLRNISDKLSYVVRNPHDSLVYFTVDNRGKSQLYVRKGRRNASVTPKGWNNEIIHPVFSPDGRFLVFSASVQEGVGGYDLWCSRNNGNGWERPVNLGNRVNTRGNEIHPVFYGNYLIFASNGMLSDDRSYNLYSVGFRPGESGDPMLSSQCVVQQLPEPVNSPADDWELALDPQHEMGYWITTRNGREEMCHFRGSLNGTLYWGQVLGLDGRPVEGVEMSALKDGRVIARSLTDRSGRYNLFVQPGTDYQLSTRRAGYFIHHSTLPAAKPNADQLIAEVQYDVSLNSLPVGEPILMNNIFGPATDVDLTEQGMEQLMPVVQFLRENPTLHAVVSLYSRATSDENFDKMLNERRMNTLREFFDFYLFKADRITYQNDKPGLGLASSTGQPNALRVIFIEK